VSIGRRGSVQQVWLAGGDGPRNCLIVLERSKGRFDGTRLPTQRPLAGARPCLAGIRTNAGRSNDSRPMERRDGTKANVRGPASSSKRSRRL